MTNPPVVHAVDARVALGRLKEGNQRYVANVVGLDGLQSKARREAFATDQSPFAIVLSCSDSRVPSELVFDCGLGDLFVVRVAGNVVAPSLVGSVEFAAERFGTQLVVVMGHERCGAVSATLDVLRKGSTPLSSNVRDIVERVAPGVIEIAQSNLPEDEMMRRAVRANVRASANHLRHGSKILERRIQAGHLLVVGAEYDLDTGVVDFFDVPSA